MNEFRLNDASFSKEFFKNGYVVPQFSIDLEIIDKALHSLEGLYNYSSKEYNLNNRIENAWQHSDWVKRIACDPKIINLVSNLLGTPAFPFQTLNFEKGSQQRLHSDFYHFASTNFWQMVGVWVALEDVSIDAGPLRVVPGSHKLPYYFPEDIGVRISKKSDPYAFYSEYEDVIEEIFHQSKFCDELITLKKGQILLWHSNLLHGGGEIHDKSLTRKSQVTHYFGSYSAYFSPITSNKNMFRRSYRFPYDIRSGRRKLPFLG